MTEQKYHLHVRVMHWIMAVGILSLLVSGFAIMFVVADESVQEEVLTALHVSIGVTFLVLLVGRIALRMTHKPPPLPADLSELEKRASHAAHTALLSC